MKILVLGSGLLGITTAYELGKRGYDVTVIDRQAGSGLETSYANGGQLSYNHGEPWATPGVLPKLPGWLVRSDAPLVIRHIDWQMIRWGMAFLRNCTPTRSRVNCTTLLRLGMYSRTQFEKLRGETGIAFDFEKHGILQVYDSQKDFDAAKRQNDFQSKFGSLQRELTREACLSLEPSLQYSSRKFLGGLHASTDETGDAYLYCNALAKIAAERHNVKFLYGVTIKELLTENGVITGISTDRGDISAAGYVMAMGSYSSLLLRDIGLDIPVYPMKGYSLTIEANGYCPKLSVTDDRLKIVYTPIGKSLRVAGTAEFAGYNASINKKRIAPMVKAAKVMLPKADWDRDMQTWACLRPSTPDGPPILGPTPYRNLFLNTGHGTLGWTQAAGSASIVADIMDGRIPEILMQGLTFGR